MSRQRRKLIRRKPRLWEQLEERCLFDAAGSVDPAEWLQLIEDAPFVADTIHAQTTHDTTTAAAPDHTTASTNLIFVDTAVDDFASLLNEIEITENTEVIFLSPTRNGLHQISDELQDRENVHAIHILSHGGSGELRLGNAIIRTDQLTTTYADAVESFANALTPDADILFYGCRLGAGEQGQAFVETFSALSGADVAASDDLTGTRSDAADWELEIRHGAIEARQLRASDWKGVLAVEATDLIVTVQDAQDSGAGVVTLTNNSAPLAVTTSGTPLRVAQMLETVWEFDETADVGKATYVFDIGGITGINGTIAADFGLIVSDQVDLSGSNTTTLVASGYDATNGLVYFHGVDLNSTNYFGLATEVVADNFTVYPTASGLEDTSIDLGLALNPALVNGGTLRDIIATATGFRTSSAGNATTDFYIPAGTTGIKITGYSTRDIGTPTNDATNDDYQTMNVSIDLNAETSNGFIAYLVDQGPSRSDQFGWTGAPLGAAILSGGATITGDADDNINPTFTIVDGVLRITENHQLQTAYHVEFLTNATSSAEFIQTASAVREDGDQTPVALTPPTNADFVVLSIADAATSSDSQVEYKGNSRIYIDLETLTASGAVAAQRGETDARVVTYAFQDYDVSSASVGSVLSSTASVVGDTAQTIGTLNDSQIYIDGSGNIVIDRENTFASNFKSLITVEYYERKDVGSSAEKLGESTDYGLWNADPSDPVSTLEFDIPPNATLGIMNLSMNGTRTSDTNENMGAGFAVIDLVNGTSSGTMYMVRTSNIVDFVAWDSTNFGTVFFEDPTSISNHTNINQFNDKFAGNAGFNLINGGTTLELSTHSPDGTQTWRDYYAGGQIEWYGTAPFELSGFPIGGTFSQGSLNNATGNWDLTIEDAISGGLFFVPDTHVSGNQPVEVSIRIGDETDTTQVRVEAVIDPISFPAPDACGDEDTDIAIDLNVTPSFVDQDGSETITAMSLSNIPIGHTISDGTNSFTASAGNQTVNITGWDRAMLTYRAQPNQSGTFTINLDVDWQDVGGGVTDTDSISTTFNVIVKPVNDPPVAVDDFYTVLGNTTLNVPAATGVLSNDSDTEGDILSVTPVTVSGPSNGTVTLIPDGSFSYTPTTGYFGTDSFVYEVSDGNGGVTTATAYIDVSEPVTGPLNAVDDFETTPEETLINIDVMANDALPTTGAFNISSTTPPSNGVITVLANGTINYTPNTDFFGVDTFTYTLSDASGRTSTAEVEITVTNTQDQPIANADSGSTLEDTTLPNINILSNDSDPDGDALTVTAATSPNGTITINGDGTIDYTPNLNFTGTDTVTYNISDGNGGSATSTVLINVVPVADAPTSADHTVCSDEDGEYIFNASDFAFADGDPFDTLTTIRIDTLPADGDVLFMGSPVTAGQVVSLGDITAGRLAFKPDPDGFGNPYTSFTFSVSDGALFQVTPNTMTVCVLPLQDAPVADNNSLIAAEESTGTPLGLAAPTDVDGDALTITVTGLPSLGTVFLSNGITTVTNGQTLTIAQLTSLVYDAPTDFTVPAAGSFTYDVTDGTDTTSGAVDITLTPVNDPPTIDLDGVNAGENYKNTFTEGNGAVPIAASNVTIADPDSSELQSITITPGGIVDGPHEVLTIGGFDFALNANQTQNVTVSGTTFAVSYASGTFTITLLGVGNFPTTVAESLLGSATYRNDSPFPSTSDRTFDIQVADDLGSTSNLPRTTICVVRDSEFAAWTLTGTATVVDSGTANYAVALSSPLRNGETASVDLSFTDVDTNSSDYNAFNTAVTNAVTAYTGPGTLVWNGTTLTFTSDGTGAMSTLPLAIITTPDAVYEGDEDYTISLSNPTSTTGETISLGASSSLTTTIFDNTPPPTINISNASAVEGVPLEFTVSLDLISHEDITLNLVATSGTATAVADFETTGFEYFDGTTWVAATNGTEITLPAGTMSLQVRIDTVPEFLVETDETLTVSANVLSGNVTNATDTGAGTIVNDDVASLSIDDITVDENNGTLTFTVTLDQPSSNTVTVNYATSSGSATSGTDFVSASGVLTFNPNEQSKTISVTINDDNLYEQSESFGIELSGAVGAGIADSSGLGTIVDDGTGPNNSDDDRPSFSVDNVTATETTDSHAEFTISLTNPSTENIVLAVALNNITATAGDDYGSGLEFFDGAAWLPVAGNITIAANTTTLRVRTPILDDAYVDSGETYSLVVTQISGTTLNTSATGTGTILDDPIPDVTEVGISGPTQVTEGSSAAYTVTIDNAPLTDVTVTFSFSGTASGATDYSGVGSVTIPAGSLTGTFTIPTVDDTLGEPLENFTVTINAITGGSLEATQISVAQPSVTTNIVDDDTPVISINDVIVTEGSDPHAEFTVELSNPTYEDISFSISAADVTANGETVDYGILGITELEVFDGTTWTPLISATISAGDTSIRLRTPIHDDVISELTESFDVTVTKTAGTTVNPSDVGTGTIQEDTSAPETVHVSIAGPPTVAEGATTTPYTLSLTHTPVEDVTITLTYGGIAADGTDFTGVATVAIPTGATSKTFNLPTVDDSLYEGNEEIVISIASVTGGGFESIAPNPTASEVTTLITDAADIPTLSVNNVTSIEGTDDFAVYSIELNNLSVEDIEVSLSLAGGTATGSGTDFGAPAAGNLQVYDGTNWIDASTATIPAGQFTVQVRTPIVDDPIDEPSEHYALTLDVTAGTTTTIQVVGTGTILDDDPAPDVAIDDAIANEGDPLVFSVTLSNPSSSPIVLEFSASNATATSPGDYNNTSIEYTTDGGTTWLPAAGGSEVTIPAMMTSVQVRLATTEDSTLETTESMQLSIANVVTGIVGDTSAPATGTISDDDNALISIFANTPSAGEPATDGQFTITMTNPSDTTTTISYSVAGTSSSGTDFVALPGTITLAAGTTVETLDLSIIDDAVVEGIENVTITLTGITIGDADISIAPTLNTATATIADDDFAIWSLIGGTSVNEGAAVIYNVNLSGTLQAGEAVSVELALIDDSTQSADHESLATSVANAVAAYSGPGSLNWTGNTLTFTSDGTGAMAQLPISIAATNDTHAEGAESFSVTIANPGSTTGAAAAIDTVNNQVETTIGDTIDAAGTELDTTNWSISGPAVADEGAIANYTIALDTPLGVGETASVVIGLTDIDASANDYSDFISAVTTAAAANTSVTFNAVTGTLTYTAPTDGASMSNLVVNLDITNDVFIEGPEDFRIDLSAASSTTDAAIAIDTTSDTVTTTIADTQGVSGSHDGPALWCITGAAAADEGETARYTVSLAGQFGIGEVVTVDIGLSDLDTNASDYASINTAIAAAVATNLDISFDATSGTLTYTSSSDGASMADLIIDLGIVNDSFIEGPESLTLSLANSTTSTGAAVAIDTTSESVTTTINDTQGSGGAADGPGQWSIVGPTDADEGTTAQFTVSLSGQFGADEVVSVILDLTDNTTNSSDYADFAVAIASAATANPDVIFNTATSTLTYSAPTDGATMPDLVIDLGMIDDLLIEGSEDFTVTLSNATTSTGAAVGIVSAADSVTTTINDTQGPGGAIDGPATWSITGPTAEDEGATPQYIITLQGIFGIGETAIVDIDLVDITTSPNDHAVLDAAITGAVAANPSLSYDTTTGTLTYTAQTDGDSMTPIVVSVLATNDAFVEGPEHYSISLSNASSNTDAAVTIHATNNSVTTTINDTQGPGGLPDGPATWSITGTTSEDEGAIANYRINLSQTFGDGETATVRLGLTDIETNSNDYADFASAVQSAIALNPTLSFNNATGILTYTSPNDGSSMAEVSLDLSIVNDAFIEGAEDYTIALTAAGSNTGALVSIDTSDHAVTTTIEDTRGIGGIADGPGVWSINGPTSADEGTTAQYAIALSGQYGFGETVTVDVMLTNNTANNSDYSDFVSAIQTAVASNSTLAFNAGTGTLSFTAPSDGASMSDLVINLGIINDSLIEGAEDFEISIANAATSTDATVIVDAAAGSVNTVIDDTQGSLGPLDGPAMWSITGPTTADEGDMARYTVSLSGQFGIGELVTVDLTLVNNTTNASDYASISAAIAMATAAAPNVSYNSATGTLTYTAPADGAVMSDIVIDLAITNDAFIEGPEDFTLALTNATSTTDAFIAIDVSADDVTTIIDDTQGSLGASDGPALWAITGPTSVDEGDTSQYTVSLSGQFGINEVATVHLNLTDNTTNASDYASITTAIATAATANPNVSYNAANGTLTYTAPTDGASMVDLVIDLGINDDTFIEGPEEFTLALTHAATTTGAEVAIDATLNDITTVIDDTQGPLGAGDGPASWSISGPASADEGATPQYTVSLSGQFGIGETVTVDLHLINDTTTASDYASITAAITTAALATPNLTYDAATGALTYIAPADGASMADLVIAVGITDDTFIEGPESFTLALTNATTSTGAAIAINAASDDVTTIIDDTQGPLGALEGPALWSIVGSTSADEGAIAHYTVALSGQFGAGEIVTVDLDLMNNSTNPSDYASITAAITAAAAANSNVTYNTSTGTLIYNAPSDGASMADLLIELNITDDAFIEGAEDFTLTLTNATTTTDAAVAIDLALDDVTTVIDDTQGPLGFTDGPALWSITGPTSVDEGGSAQYTVALSGQFGIGEVVTVDLNLIDNTTNAGDYANITTAISAPAAAIPGVTYNSTTGTLTFTATSDGATMSDLVLDLGITNDVWIEGPESFVLALTNPATTTGAAVAIDAMRDDVVTVIDDTKGPLDAPEGPALWSITGPTSADEGDTAQFTVSLSGEFGIGEVITVELNLTDNLTNSTDYASITTAIGAAASADPSLSYDPLSGTLTYTAPSDGSTMEDLVIDLAITNDLFIEGPEDFTLALTNAATTTGAAVSIDNALNDVTTVIDDTQGSLGPLDGPGMWSIAGATSADEGTIARYTIALSGQFGLGETVSADLILTNNTTNASDFASITAAIAAATATNSNVSYDASTNTLTYTAPSDGATMSDLVIDLAITDDVLIEGPEDFTLALTNAATSTGAAIAIDLAADVVTTVIDDSQGPHGAPDGPAIWSITGTTSTDEGSTAQYAVGLSGRFGMGEVVNVNLNLTDNTTNPSDYADMIAAITAAAATNLDATFDASTGQLTYTAPSDGASMANLVIDIGITNDAFIEGPEAFTLALTNATTSTDAAVAIDSTLDNVTTVIDDTQGPFGSPDGPALWSITGTTSADEGTTAQYTVALAGQFGIGEIVTVDLELTNNTTNASDFASITSAITFAAALNPDVTYNATNGTLTYIAPSDAASMPNLEIDLGITNDTLIEGAEDFTLALINAQTSTAAAIAIDSTLHNVTTIIDDTQGPLGSSDGPALWSITGPTSTDEGDTAQYLLSLSGQFGMGEVVTVDLNLTDNTTNPSDYASISAAITTAAAANPDVSYNSTSGTLTYTAPADGATMTDLLIDIGIIDDAFIEGPENYSLSLTNPTTTTGAAVAIDLAFDDVTTVIDDTQGSLGPADGPALWSITGTTSADEGTTAQYAVALSGRFGIGEVLTVDLTIVNNTTNMNDYADITAAVSAAVAAQPDVTYNPSTGTLTYTSPFDGASMPDLIINLGIANDTFIEGPENFTLSLSNATPLTGAAVAIDPTNDDVTTVVDDTQGPLGALDGPARWCITGTTLADEGTTAQYTVSLSGEFGLGEDAMVQLSLADTSTNTNDYAAFTTAIASAVATNPHVIYDPSTGIITFTAASDGATMSDLVISLGITNDSLIEGTEDFTLILTDATSTTDAAVSIDPASNDVTTVIDDTQGPLGPADGPALWSIIGTTSADEGTTAQYSVALSGQFGMGEVVTVDLNLTDNETNPNDYASTSAAIAAAAALNPDVTYNASTGTLTYNAPVDGGSMTDLVIDIGITDDPFTEGPEDFAFALTNATTSTDASVAINLGSESVTTVIDDTQGPLGPTDGPALWSITGPTSTDEGATAQYIIAMSGQFGINEVVTVDLNLIDNTTNSNDYAGAAAAIAAAATANPDVSYDAANGTLTYIAPNDGASMSDLLVNLGITNDTFIEGPEYFVIALSNATTTTGAAVAVDPTMDDVATVIDDTQGSLGAADGPAVWSITGTTSADEGTTAQYAVSLSGQFGVGEVVTVDLNLADNTTNTGDYASITAAIALAAAANPDVTFNPATGTLTYTSPADGATMTDLVINLAFVNDVFLEGPEHLSLDLTNATTTTDAAVTIDSLTSRVTTVVNDTQSPGGDADGPAQWSITGPINADEGATAQFTVSLSQQFGSGESVAVDLKLTDNTTNANDYSDLTAAIAAAVAANPDVTYNTTTGTLTYTAPSDGASMSDLVIDLGIDNDQLIEGLEDFTLALTNATTTTDVNVGIDTFDDDVTTLIFDTQGPGGSTDGPATWSIAGAAEVAESTNATYTISLTGQFQAGEVVSVLIAQSDNTTNAADYENLFREIETASASNPNLTFDTTSGTLTYTAPVDGASMTPLLVTLPITDDSIVETSEDFDITLSNATTTTGAAVAIDTSAHSINTVINGDPHVNDDTQHTTVDTQVSDNVLVNDTDPDGDPLTVATSPVTGPSSGSVILHSNGDYTYTPNPGFRGVDSFDYEVCDDMGNCETASVTIVIADLSAAKEQINVVANGENFDVTFAVTVANTGSARMDNLTLFDNIAGQFGATYLSVSTPVLDSSGIIGGVAPTLNATWPANTASDLLKTGNTTEFLMPGDSFTITYTVTLDPDAGGTAGYLRNQATVAGDDVTTLPTSPLTVSDVSDSGSAPDTNNVDAPGDTNGSDDPTPVYLPDLGIAKRQIGSPIQIADGSWNIDFELIVENTGSTDLTSPTLHDNVLAQFGTAWHGSSNLAIDTNGVSAGGTAPGLNSLWLVDPTLDIFDGTGQLKPGEFVRVTFTLNIDPDDFVSGLSRSITNQATGGGTATDSNGAPINDGSGNPILATDDSDSGFDPNTSNSGAAGDSGATDDPTPLVLPEIGAANRIVEMTPATTDGNTNVTYEIILRNIGSVDLTNLTLTEDIESTIGTGFVGIVSPPSIVSSSAAIDPIIDGTWDGNLNNTGNASLFDGTSGLLRPGQQIVLRFVAEMDVDQLTTTSNNQVHVSGHYDSTPGSPGGNGIVSDWSDTGDEPSGNNPDATGDSNGEDDRTLIPALGIAKDHGEPIPVGQNFLIPVTLYLENLGSTDLTNLTLADDLQSQLGDAFAGVSNVAINNAFVVGGSAASINSAWPGDGTNILSSGLLAPGDVVIVTFDVTVNPDAGGKSAPLFNSAIASGSDPNAPSVVVIDLSDSGTSPHSGNPGEPGDNNTSEDATPIQIADAGVAKRVTNMMQIGAQYELTIELVLENTGTVDLASLILNDDLATQFGPHFANITGAPILTASTATNDPVFNAGYLADTAQNIFDGTSGLLKPGEFVVVELRVLVDASGNGTTTLINQATGGGQGVDDNGNPLQSDNGAPIAPVTDDSDSGSDPNGNNLDEPGDTGGYDDPTMTPLQFFTFDAFNNFSEGFVPVDSPAATSHRSLSKMIPSLSPEPVFSGTARPGTQIVGRVYDSAGHLIGESISTADVGGNWMMQMHSTHNVDNARIEFTEIAGTNNQFQPNGDIYGYLGVDQKSNHYASLEPWTGFDSVYDFNAVLSGSASARLARLHQQDTNSLGLGNNQ